MRGNRFGGDLLDHLGKCRLRCGPAFEQAAYRIGNLLPPAIGDGDVELEPVIAGSGAFRRTDRGKHRLGQHRQAADRPHPHAPAVDGRVARQSRQLGFDRAQDAGNFGGRALEVVGGENPQRDRRDAELGTPVEHVVELLRA